MKLEIKQSIKAAQVDTGSLQKPVTTQVAVVTEKPVLKEAFKRNSHRLRLKFYRKGVATMESGSYAAKRLNTEVLAALAKRLPVKEKEAVKGFVLVSERGILVRPCEILKDRQTFFCSGKVMSLEAFEPGRAKLLTRDELIEILVQKGYAARIEIKDSKERVQGIAIGERGDGYSTLFYVKGNQLRWKDIETKRNKYNAKELVSVIGTDQNKEKLLVDLRKVMMGNSN
jgi:hypothetical protein